RYGEFNVNGGREWPFAGMAERPLHWTITRLLRRSRLGRTSEMRKRTFWISAVVVTLLAVGLIAHASAGNGPGSTVLKFKTMVGTIAPYTGTANPIRGIAGAGSPWSIDTANGKLDENGDLSIKVTGLIITGTGANPEPLSRA